MKKLLVLLLALIPLTTVAETRVGMTEEEVIEAYGEPKSTMSRGNRKVMIYADSVRIELIDGQTIASQPLPDYVSPAPPVTTTDTSDTQPVEDNSESNTNWNVQYQYDNDGEPQAEITFEEMEFTTGTWIALAVFSLASLVNFIAGLWLLINAFRESIAWGLSSFFIPFVVIIFAITHWETAKRPFLLMVGATIVAIIAVIGLNATVMSNMMPPA